MNKKGFTLTELIAVIAILGILATISTPAVFAIRKNVLSNSLESKISQIIAAAEDYGSENIMLIPSPVSDDNVCSSGEKCNYIESDDCLIVLVKTLISHGYMAGDSENKELLLNPIDGSYLNSERVCIRFDSNNAMKRKMFAYIINEDELRDWNSSKYKK